MFVLNIFLSLHSLPPFQSLETGGGGVCGGRVTVVCFILFSDGVK